MNNTYRHVLRYTYLLHMKKKTKRRVSIELPHLASVGSTTEKFENESVLAQTKVLPTV